MLLVLAFWTSPNGEKVGAFGGLAGPIFVDKTTNVNITKNDLSTVGFLFHSNNGIGRLGQDILTRRILITDSDTDELCGYIKVELYTFFNVKFVDTSYRKGCP